ncbi:MAG: monovalent cation/H(+) antiporter subunit G [Firmicutes bacterium]|nr:monovalent cation/H(+) antiporter subunit G [Bacillota bacterium]
MREQIGNILIVTALIFIFFGVYGIFKFKDFYPRILISSKVDTVGLITLMLGIIVKSGINFFSLKVLIILLLVIITNPLSTHSIARSAYISGYKVKKE